MLLYRLLNSLVSLALALALLWRVVRGQESLSDFAQRLGFWRTLPAGNVLWIHGASIGELSAARPIIQRLHQTSPKTSILITSNTTTARATIESWGMDGVTARLAPLDLRWVYRRLMGRVDLCGFILLEGDFWPSRLFVAQTLGVPLALIGGRMSARSFKGWQRFAGLAQQIIRGFDLICPQDHASGERFRKLGANPVQFGPELALKSLVTRDPADAGHSRSELIWLAASTHAGEDAILLRAHALARRSLPDLKMILAPRHPERGDAIAEIARAEEFTVAQRSAGALLATPCNVLIADTLGEMKQWYSASYACFVAGSLVDKGGHTPFEPTAQGCAILHGPYFENFVEPYAALAAANASLPAETAEQIATSLITLADPETAARHVAAAQLALSPADTLDAVLDALKALVLSESA